MKFKFITIIICIFNIFYIIPQINNENSINDVIEYTVQNFNEEIDLSEYYDDLSNLINNPVHINYAGEEDLDKLVFLSEFQKRSLILYREENGLFLSPYEIQLVYGFDMKLAQLLIPFIDLSIEKGLKITEIEKPLKKGKNQLLIRTQRVIEQQEGYLEDEDSIKQFNPNSTYLGNPYKIYTRYNLNYEDKLYAGFIGEKDPGEPFFKGINRYGFDFYSGYLQINKTGIFKTINIGDYQVNFGQGLIVWTGFSLNKSPNVINIVKTGQGIRNYNSVNENNFFRGISSTIKLSIFDISVFLSKKNIDGNIMEKDSITEEVISISSVQNTGLHNTYNLGQDKDAITETSIGTSIKLSRHNYKYEAIFLNQKFDVNFIQPDKPYKLYGNLDNKNYYTGFSYQYYLKNFYLFGEAAYQFNHGFSSLNGLMIKMVPGVEYSVLYRNYSKDYYSMYGNAFAEYSKNQNEQGLYMGLNFKPFNKISISTYYDFFRFDWLKYNVDAPSNGNDFFLQINYTHSTNLQMYFRYKTGTGQENFSDADSLNLSNRILLTDIKQNNFRYQIDYRISENFKLRNRIEYLIYDDGKTKENGFVLYQDINYQFTKLPLSCIFRFSIFDSESYNSRIYTYENDVLYSFSVIPNYNEGFRTYYIIKYRLNRNFTIWLKYSLTNYNNINSIGNGINAIQGNKKSEIKFQVRYIF